MGRSPCCSKEGLNRGAWTAQEDQILIDFIKSHGEGRWRALPKKAGLKRCGKSCRLRWLNYLRPGIKRGNISPDEEELIIRLHKLLGNRWSLIAGRLPGRTDNEIKNYWNTILGKKVNNDHKASEDSTLQPTTQFHDKQDANPTRPATAERDSNVVRTKAAKCSQAFKMGSFFSKTEAAPRSTEVHQPTDKKLVESQPCDGLLAAFDLQSNLMEDFDAGELCISDLLNTNFSGLCEFNYNNDGDGNGFSSQEMFTNWSLTDCAFQPNVGPLASFLDYGGDWLGE